MNRINFRAIFTVLLIGVIAFNAYQLIIYMKEGSQADALNEQLAAIHIYKDESDEEPVCEVPQEDTQEDPHSTEPPAAEAEDENGIIPAPEHTAETTITQPDTEESRETASTPANSKKQTKQNTGGGLTQLRKKNSDCIAWITIDGTVIDYPVMYSPGNPGYYLHRNFNGKKASGGTLFLSEICDIDTSDNLIIYGHNMKNGTMFAALTKYKSKPFWQNHRFITLEATDGIRMYEVICALATDVSAGNNFPYYEFSHASNKDEFDAYIAICKHLAYYDTGLTAEYGDQLLTLSTCEYTHENGRFLVIARRIK